jgi:Zn-dependent protease with chaperone function
MRDDEILSVMGHEMGHYKLAHIWKTVVFFIVLSFVLYYFSWRSTRWAVARFGDRWGFTDLADIASLPLIFVTITVLSLVVQPAVSGFSRMQEHEADVFGLEVTRNNDAAARAFIKLASQNKSNPEPPKALEWFLYTHPPLIDRVRFAMEYRPWEEGKPNRWFRPKG